MASDFDPGSLGQLSFNVSDDHFSIISTDGKTATIKVAKYEFIFNSIHHLHLKWKDMDFYNFMQDIK